MFGGTRRRGFFETDSSGNLGFFFFFLGFFWQLCLRNIHVFFQCLVVELGGFVETILLGIRGIVFCFFENVGT